MPGDTPLKAGRSAQVAICMVHSVSRASMVANMRGYRIRAKPFEIILQGSTITERLTGKSYVALLTV